MASDSNTDAATETKEPAAQQSRRKIPGGFPYTSAPGVLARVLEKIPISEKPSVFSNDFLTTVMEASGGSSRPIIPILKATGFLSQSAAPTELYAQFQTDGGRAAAALQALKHGFSEIFKRNQYAHKADEKTIVDAIVSTTGLPKNDPVVRYILKTFEAFNTYASMAKEESPRQKEASNREESSDENVFPIQNRNETKVGLVYNINITLPETTNIEVYNAIFKSIKGNLL